MAKTELMAELIKKLNAASEAYYGGQDEIMSNYEWDLKFDELKKLEKETGIILPDSPTAKVSESTDSIKGRKVAHEYPALSLAKTKNVSDLVKWADGRLVWVSWKLDGLTLVVTYDKGKLKSVVTRGDGHIGTDITHLAKAIGGILPAISYKDKLIIRGEAVISNADFDAYLKEYGTDYSNPRNLAAGSLNLDDVNELAKRCVQWIPFTLVYAGEFEDKLDTWGNRMEFLRGLGFDTVEADMCSPETLVRTLDSYTEIVEEGLEEFPVDGLVLTYQDWVYSQSGTVTGHHANRAGYAFKWKDESVDTELISIEWSCAAQAITPVAVFRPVQLEGTTVERASLCNISECKRLGIGKGSVVSVIKANKIIPKIIAATPGKLDIPDKCPVCGVPTEITVSESGCEVLICTNDDCAAKFVSKFTKFVSKHAMNIDGLSEATLKLLCDIGWVQEFADIYALESHRTAWMQMEGFGEKSVSKLLDAIEKSKQVAFRNYLYACCIPDIGREQSKVISKYLEQAPYAGNNLYEKFLSAIDAQMDFSVIDGIGEVRNKSLYAGWNKHRAQFTKLASLLTFTDVYSDAQGTDIPAKNGGSAQTCAGLTFVITGDVHHFANRDAFKEYVEAHGGKVAGSVSGKTSFLVSNDVSTGTGKLKKAADLGVPIITENEFVSRY